MTCIRACRNETRRREVARATRAATAGYVAISTQRVQRAIVVHVRAVQARQTRRTAWRDRPRHVMCQWKRVENRRCPQVAARHLRPFYEGTQRSEDRGRALTVIPSS